MAERAGLLWWQVKVLVLQALAHAALDERARAAAMLAEALALAAPAGYVRLFADAGAPMADLLRAAQQQGLAPDYVARLLAAFPDFGFSILDFR